MFDWRDSNGFQYFAVGVSTAVMFAMSVIFVVELYQTIIGIRQWKSTNVKFSIRNAHSYYFAFPLLIYLCYIIHGFSQVVINFKLSNNCDVFGLAETLTYSFSKLFLYEFFILRLHVIYSATCFQYNTKILLFLAAFILFYTGATIIFIVVNHSTVIVHRSVMNFCIAYIPFFIYVVGALLDQIITFFAVYLFVKPLIALIKLTSKDEASSENNSSKSNTPNTQNKLLRNEHVTIVKLCALSFIASITTFLVLLSALFAMSNVQFAIDMLVNAMCVLLMNSYYSKLYQSICCFTNKMCEKCVICICFNTNIQKETKISKSELQLSDYVVQNSASSPSNSKHTMDPVIT